MPPGADFGDDVGLFHHFQKDFFALWVLEIQGDALLIRVQRHEIGTIHPRTFLPAITPWISTLWLLDFDHVGAQPGQDLGTRCPSLELCQVEDVDIIQRSTHERTSYLTLRTISDGGYDVRLRQRFYQIFRSL